MHKEERYMAVVEFRTSVDMPSPDAFAFLSDLQNHAEWSGGNVIRKTSQGPIGVGATYETEDRGPFGVTIREKSEVMRYEPNVWFAWRTYGPLGSWLDWSFELRPQHDGTVLIERFEPKRSLLTTVLWKLFFERQMRREVPETLEKIRILLEQR
jgi:hypothetical protein